MALSSELISQFVKATKDTTKTKSEATVYGTTVIHDGVTYVKLDGSNSDILTPVSTTTSVKDGERVTVSIKNHTATITGNISSPAARSGDVEDTNTRLTELDHVVANKATIGDLEVERARIDAIIAGDVVVEGNLSANTADIVALYAEDVKIKQQLTAAEANIDSLDTKKLDASVADITYATIAELDATNANIHNLESTYADINTLIFGSATGNTIQTSFANAVIAQLGDAQIKSAMIKEVSASKITAGDIITNNVRVKSQNGLLLISDETIQISDNYRVRVQIGKDSANDYSINVWDADGNLMFSKGGITDSAIKEAIIRNDMVSDTANIAAHKLDIDSLFEEINGSTNTIKSTKIYLDDEAQTLDVAFKTIETEVSNIGTTVSSQGTQLNVIQGQISSKIWQQDIDTATNEMNTQYSLLEQEVDGISATVVKQTSDVTTVNNRVTNLETNLNGFKTTVSDTYATKTEIADIEIGGRNLVAGTSRWYEYSGNASGVTYKDILVLPTIDPAIETDYVVSFDAKADVAQNITCYFYNPETTRTALSSTGQSSAGANGNCQVSITTEWKRYWVKWTHDPTDSIKYIIVGRVHTENNVYIRGVKFEAGSIPTDWTPAPEDVDADVSAAHQAASNVQSNLDNLTIGGRNLLRNSKGDDITGWVHTGLTIIEDDVKGQCVQRSTTGTPAEVYISSTRTDIVESSTEYTFSADLWCNEYLKNYEIFWLSDTYDDPKTSSGYVNVLSTHNRTLTPNTWQRVEWTFTTNETDRTGFIRIDNNGPTESGKEAILRAANIKLEKGNKATDWTPAPEDLADRVSAAETQIIQNESSIASLASRTTTVENKFTGYSTTEQMNSAIKQSADSINSSVSEIYATKNTVSGLTSRMTNVESEVAQNASDITSVVSRTTDNETDITSLQQTADGLTLRITNAESDITTAQNTANTAKTNASNAAKTATNYIKGSSSGLVVGDMTVATLGKNVLIDTDSVDIRNGDTVLASFGAKDVVLGQNSEDSVISLCDGAATIRALTSASSTTYPKYDSMQLDSQEIVMNTQNTTLEALFPGSGWKNSANVSLTTQSTCGGSAAALRSNVTTVATGNKVQTGILAQPSDNPATSYTKVYAESWDASAGAWTSNGMTVYPTVTQFSQPISINGTKFTGNNKVLWSGGYHMIDGHTCTLSESVSSQPNGIVLVFCEYYNEAVQSSAFHTVFVPKQFVIAHNGAGHTFHLSTYNAGHFAIKYLYIQNTGVIGHVSNTNVGTAASGIAYTNSRFVLRYIIGV